MKINTLLDQGDKNVVDAFYFTNKLQQLKNQFTFQSIGRMIESNPNIFEQAAELVSLNCSSVQNMTLSRNFSHSYHQSLKQSILNLKTVLPTFTSEFNLFKQHVLDMSFYIANKLMNGIKQKSTHIQQLNQQLQKSLTLNNTMKKEVIQLKQMIAEFMENYKKQIAQKDKLIQHKQQELHHKNQQISLKLNQINELKNVLQSNFNSPRNICQTCQSKINNQDNLLLNVFETNKKDQIDQKNFNSFIKNYSEKEEPLIQMSESIVCHLQGSSQKMPLEVIQQEPSDINSITDYLQSHRCSQKENTSKGSSQFLKSSRTHYQNEKDNFLNQQRFNMTQKFHEIKLKDDDNDQTIKNRNPLVDLKICTNFQQNKNHETFSSRPNYKELNKEFVNVQSQRERRCSQQIVVSKPFYSDTHNQNIEKNQLKSYNVQIQTYVPAPKQQLSLKAQIEQISKSSSSSDIMHFGDTDKINVNLPKMLQTPKNMNFVKKNSSRPSAKQQRLKTQPTQRNSKFSQNKENVNIQYQQKPLEMGRKIFARKKIMMTHAKPAHTSRVQSKKLKEQTNNPTSLKKLQPQFELKHNNFIEIKCIESPEKQPSKSSHLLNPSIPTIFSTEISTNSNSRASQCMDYNPASSSVSIINESVVKSHHLYHSSTKYQSNSTPKNSHDILLTPGKHQNRTQQKKRSSTKSKEKLKVTSKNNHEQNSIHQLTSQSKKQRILTEINQNQLLNNYQSITKLKNKNISVHIGGNSKSYLRQNLQQIKHALANYSLDKFLNSLKEVYFDGQIINGQKEGFGKIVYDNGMNYEGEFKQGKRFGNSKITLNGIDVFEGQFENDSINGQGYLKFLRFFTKSNDCGKIFQDASYFGRFCGNRFDGMGTLFLNQKQKIVTKFHQGIPFGQVTFYTENNIQFGHWGGQNQCN